MKENADREINELKLQLKMVEESRDAVRRDFIEAQRKIRESEEGREMGRKEISELRRMLKDEEKEKEAIQFTTNELRTKVKKSVGGSSSLSIKIIFLNENDPCRIGTSQHDQVPR